MRIHYHVPQSTYYLVIIRIKFRCNEYIKAHVRWIDKATMKPMGDIRNLKIMQTTIDFWHKEYK